MPKRVQIAVTLSAIARMNKGDVIHDTTLKGFGARCQGTAISYFLKCRVDGRQRWFTIGRHGQPWTPDSARKRALQLLANPALGDKPKPTNTPLFGEIAKEFLASHGPKLKPSTRSDYESFLGKYLHPAFGTMPITDITRSHVSSWHAKHADKPRTANYALAILSKIMTWAEDQGYRPDHSNPVRRIQRYKETKRETFLTADELGRLGEALDQAEAQHLAGPYALAAIRLLILTGARLTEMLTLEWSHVDLDRKMIFLPDSKTGKKPLALNDAAIEVLSKIPRLANNPYVIVGNRNGAHLVNLQRPWQTVRALAKLSCRIHDLRHTFASYAVAAGGSLPVIGRQLGHRQPITTQRYAHLADDPVQQLTQTTGQTLAAALKRKPA